MKKVKVLVIDTNALLKSVHLASIGEEIYTIPQVISEVRDKQSRDFLSSIDCADIKIKAPTPESIKKIADFSKKTGDYASLSVVDMRLLALSLDLEMEANNGKIDHLRYQPFEVVTQIGGRRDPENDVMTSKDGWFTPDQSVIMGKDEQLDIEDIEEQVEELQIGDIKHDDTEQQVENVDEDDGWITPSNIKKKTENMRKRANRAGLSGLPTEEDEQVKVACMTSDFAMQNVLLQMGLNLVSVDGMQIRQVKNWILRCHACFNIERNMEKRFCDKCGGPTLIRTSMSIDPETGKMTLYLKKNFQYRIRGTKYAVPETKGGREANLIFREDQKEFQKAIYLEKKAKNRILKHEQDVDGYEFGSARHLELPSVTIGYGKKNPNESKKRVFGKK